MEKIANPRQDSARSHQSSRKFEEVVEEDRNKEVFTGLVKEAGSTNESIVELFWINDNIVAALTQDETNNLYMELFCIDEGIQTVTDSFMIHSSEKSGVFEQIKVNTDSSRQLFTIFLYNTVRTCFLMFSDAEQASGRKQA